MIELNQTPKETNYVEPIEFFPKSVRKEFGLGEFYNKEKDNNENHNS